MVQFGIHFFAVADGAVAARSDGPSVPLVAHGLEGIQAGVERIDGRVLGMGGAVAGLAHESGLVHAVLVQVVVFRPLVESRDLDAFGPLEFHVAGQTVGQAAPGRAGLCPPRRKPAGVAGDA